MIIIIVIVVNIQFPPGIIKCFVRYMTGERY